MNAATREKVVSAVEKSIVRVGAENYEDGMGKAIRITRLALILVEKIETKENLRALLDKSPELSKGEESLVLLLFRSLPHVLRLIFIWLANDAKKTLPSISAGRPNSTTTETRQAVVNHIGHLHTNGLTFKDAKKRAAQKFGQSPRTIERIWSQRGCPKEDELTIQEAIQLLLKDDSPMERR